MVRRHRLRRGRRLHYRKFLAAMNLFVDTETSDLWHDDLPADHPSQPHIIQIAAKLCDDAGEEHAAYHAIVRPNDWSITPQAQAIHGISERRAYRVGVPVLTAMTALRGMASMAKRAVNHGMDFDRRMIVGELRRLGSKADWFDRDLEFWCTMEEGAVVMALPGPIAGVGKYPTLGEAHAFFVPDVPFVETHDARLDMEAAARIYWAMVRMRQ